MPADSYTLASVAAQLRRMPGGKSVVLAAGTFDLLHAGHIEYLEWCKRHGDLLVICIAGDGRVRRRKGPGRPILSQRARARLVSALKPVDAVFISNRRPFSDRIIDMVSPTVVVTSADEPDPERKWKFVQQFRTRHPSIRIVLRPRRAGRYPHLSTSSMIEKIEAHR